MRPPCCLLFWLLLIIAEVPLWAQVRSPAFVVEHIGLKEGLPTGDIRTLLRDRQGYLWLGTDSGLLRYDGFTFQPLTTTAAGQSIGPVTALLEDRAAGGLWAGTDEGLLWVETSSGREPRARAVRYVQGGDFVNVGALVFDKKQTLWLGTGGGAYSLSRAEQYRIWADAAVQVRPAPLPGFVQQEPDPTHRQVFSLAVDAANSLYVGGKYALYRYGVGEGLYCLWQPPGGGKAEVRALAVRSPTDLVLASAGEPFAYVRIQNGQASVMGRSGVFPSDVLWDGQQYWYLSYGLKRQRPTDPQPTELLDLYQTVQGELVKLYLDGEGIFWMATNEGLWRARRSAFGVVPLPEAVAGSEVNGLGTYRGRLLLGAHHGRVFAGLPHAPLRPLLPDLAPIAGVSGLAEDGRGTLWLATTYQGLFSYNGQRTHAYTAADGLGNPGFNDLIISKNGTLWAVGDVGITHLMYDSLTRANRLRFYEYRQDRSRDRNRARIRFTIFYGGYEAPDQTLWLASDAGLVSFRAGTFRQHPILIDGSQVRSVRAVAHDGAGQVWLATSGQGLLMGRIEAGTFRLQRTYTTTDGLAANALLTVFCDSRGTVWAGTATALHRLTKPGTPAERLQTYTYREGFFTDSYQFLHLTEYPVGTLWIAASCRLLRMELGDTRQKPFGSETQGIASLRVYGQFSGETDAKTGLPLGLELPPGPNALTFSFGLLRLANAPANRYRFRLVGADAAWRYSRGNDRSVTYAGLSAGTYTFEVVGTSASGDESEPVRFTFRVLRPVWQRGWFLGLAVVLLGGSAWAYVRARERQQARRAAEQSRIRQQMAELETRAIRSQMNPHFIFNCLNAIQSCIWPTIPKRPCATSRSLRGCCGWCWSRPTNPCTHWRRN
jgi:ligand-binding sensor domain-containing protein